MSDITLLINYYFYLSQVNRFGPDVNAYVQYAPFSTNSVFLLVTGDNHLRAGVC